MRKSLRFTAFGPANPRKMLALLIAVGLVAYSSGAALALKQGFAAVLTGQYDHEGVDPLSDDSGNSNDLTNHGSVPFVAPIGGVDLNLGNKAGQYVRNGSQYLTPPNTVYTSGGDFSFTTLVRKNSEESGSYQTILGSSRFRYQFAPSGDSTNGVGRLHFGVNGAGASGPADSGEDFRVNQWYFTALTYDADTKQANVYLYDDSQIFKGPLFTRTASGTNGLGDMSNFRIGADGTSGIGGVDPFGGQIDGERFYSGALSPSELRSVIQQYMPNSAAQVAQYDYESPDPLADITSGGNDLANAGGVAFAAPTSPGDFELGDQAAQFDKSANSYLNVPTDAANIDGSTTGSFTFATMMRVDDDPNGHQTILSSERFRFQFMPMTENNDQGALIVEQNDAPGTGPGRGIGTGTEGDVLTEQWTFVAMTYDAATREVTAYSQDGSPVFRSHDFQFELDENNYDQFNQISNLRLGADGLSDIGSPDRFGGQMDGGRFYDNALSRRQLREVYREFNPLAGDAIGVIAEYGFEDPNPLSDDTGYGSTLTQGNTVNFVAPPDAGQWQLGSQVAELANGQNGYLAPPDDMYMPGDDFTFVGMVRKDAYETDVHETILASDRFRFQFRPTGATNDNAGGLFLQVDGDGSSGGNNGPSDGFATDQWHFVALTYDATLHDLRAYAHDGSPVFSGPAISQTALGAEGIGDMTRFRMGYDGISGIPGAGADPFVGYFDNVRFYDQVFTTSQLRDIFRQYTGAPVGPFGLVAQYDHEGADPLADQTGKGLDLTPSGSVNFVAPTAPGKFSLGDTAGEFDGGDRLTTPRLYTPEDDFSFTGFFRKDANMSGHQTILSSDIFRLQTRGTSADGADLRMDFTSDAGGNGVASSADLVSAEQWYFISMRYDASEMLLEVFLQDDSSPTVSGSPIFTRTLGGTGFDTVSQFQLGYNGLSGLGGGDAFLGQIDGARFFDFWLDAAAMQEVYDLYYIPEPGTALLLILGGMLTVPIGRRRRRTTR